MLYTKKTLSVNEDQWTKDREEAMSWKTDIIILFYKSFKLLFCIHEKYKNVAFEIIFQEWAFMQGKFIHV